jgi:sugar-specific transcriptional regulator TrmB
LSPEAKNSNVDYDESTGTDLLGRLGLTKSQARLYDILLREGPVTISGLAKRSGIHRANVYRIMSNLKNIGLIELLLGAVTKVRAVGVGEALDILIARQEEQLDMIRSVKSQTRLGASQPLMDYGMPPVRSQQIFARLLIGRHVYAQQERLIQESKEEIIQVTSMRGFLLARNIGLIDSMATKAKDGVKVRILTETAGYSVSVRSEIPKELEIRHRANTLTMLRYFIADKKHLILKMAAPPQVLDQSVALWSNSSDLIQGLHYEFERLWAASSGVR